MGYATKIVQDVEELSILATPVRLRMLGLLKEPRSATSLAEILGIPRQQANYHLRELERAEMVEFIAERRKGNLNERLFKCTADAYAVSSSLLGEMRASPETVQDQRTADYLVALGAQLIDDVSTLRSREQAAPTLAIESTVGFESEADLGQFSRELADCLTHLIRKYHRDNGHLPCRIVAFAHPEPEKP